MLRKEEKDWIEKVKYKCYSKEKVRSFLKHHHYPDKKINQMIEYYEKVYHQDIIKCKQVERKDRKNPIFIVAIVFFVFILLISIPLLTNLVYIKKQNCKDLENSFEIFLEELRNLNEIGIINEIKKDVIALKIEFFNKCSKYPKTIFDDNYKKNIREYFKTKVKAELELSYQKKKYKFAMNSIDNLQKLKDSNKNITNEVLNLTNYINNHYNLIVYNIITNNNYPKNIFTRKEKEAFDNEIERIKLDFYVRKYEEEVLRLNNITEKSGFENIDNLEVKYIKFRIFKLMLVDYKLSKCEDYICQKNIILNSKTKIFCNRLINKDKILC
jgi:hypothetical protein